MTPVFPYLIRRSEDGWRGELLLRLRNGKSAYVVHLSLEQARIPAVEMRGLASDYCLLHHLAVRVAEGLHAEINHVVIKRFGEGDDVVEFCGWLRQQASTAFRWMRPPDWPRQSTWEYPSSWTESSLLRSRSGTAILTPCMA